MRRRGYQTLLCLSSTTAVITLSPRIRTAKCEASVALTVPPRRILAPQRSIPAKISKFGNDCLTGVLRLFRTVQLVLIFFPSLALSPLLFFPGRSRHWWRLCLAYSLNFAGPAFQKLGQWASTRPDLFGAATRADLERFHSDISTEPWRYTAKTLEEAGLKDAFQEFDHVPVGAGCVAQVHRAMYLGKPVAVKVRRRNVKRRILRDVDLLCTVAGIVEAVIPMTRFMAVKETADNFGEFMKSQLDLRVEADHLREFDRVFRDGPLSKQVSFPVPMLAKETVLVETFEDGVLLSKLLALDHQQRLPPGLRKSMAQVGVKSFLEMVIVHNMTHSDLHPGNIIVRTTPPFDLKHPEKPVQFDGLVYIDAGLVTKLSPSDQVNFVALFTAVAEGDGKLAANLMVDRSRDPSSCVDRAGFIKGMSEIIDQVALNSFRLDKVRIGAVLERVLTLVHRHRVRLEPNFTSLLISIIVLEGVGRQLDGELDIFRTSVPVLIRADKMFKKAAVGALYEVATNKRRGSTSVTAN